MGIYFPKVYMLLRIIINKYQQNIMRKWLRIYNNYAEKLDMGSIICIITHLSF
jgi:hypothetical protein